jgi:hypothetical protein
MTLERATVYIVGKRPLTISYSRLIEETKHEGNQKQEMVQYFVNPIYISECLLAGIKRIGSDVVYTIPPTVIGGIIFMENSFCGDIKLTNLLVRENFNAENQHYNTASTQWKAHFQIEWDSTIISKEALNLAIFCAGSYTGLGDALGFGFGRFWVENISVNESSKLYSYPVIF